MKSMVIETIQNWLVNLLAYQFFWHVLENLKVKSIAEGAKSDSDGKGLNLISIVRITHVNIIKRTWKRKPMVTLLNNCKQLRFYCL